MQIKDGLLAREYCLLQIVLVIVHSIKLHQQLLELHVNIAQIRQTLFKLS